MDSNILRALIFFSTLLVFSSLEVFFPYRKRLLSRKDRWFGNIGMIIISNLILKIALPLGLISFSMYFQKHNIGLFNQVELPFFFEVLASLVLLDLGIYLQHILFHKVHFLWRLHRVHHADVDLDATSALRFHPIEIFISIAYKLALIFILGVGPLAILIFEVILNSVAMFNHSNLHLPAKFEGLIRLFLVTPQMHIIHHSVEKKESDTNYGFNLSIWDRLFKTYKKEFATSGEIGQTYYRKKADHSLVKVLLLPFVNPSKKEET